MVETSSFFPQIIAESESMKRVLSTAKKVAPWDSPVLLLGETGTGKELIARNIHRLSSRGHHGFVDINCACLAESLLESELFGHEKDAFTGAVARKRGLFEVAHAGSIFLDEITELGRGLQAKLLKILDTGELRRIGGETTVSVDVRLIAATKRRYLRANQEGLLP